MCDPGHRPCPRSARPTPALVSATRAPCDSLLCPVPVRRSAGLASPSACRSILMGAARLVYWRKNSPIPKDPQPGSDEPGRGCMCVLRTDVAAANWYAFHSR